MEITEELVKHLATLSRLNFTDDEIKEFKDDFKRTLNQIDELQEVNTDNIETFSKIIDAETLREDIVKDSIKVEDAVKNASKKTRTAFVVPKIVE